MASTSISKSEKSYIQTSLLSTPPLRADGRSSFNFRPILLETGVAPLANGSAKLNIGKAPREGGGGTEVIAAVKLEVEDVENGTGVDGGRIACSVICSPTAYPNLSSSALDDLQHDLTVVLEQVLCHQSLHPPNLGILPRKKSWLLNLDVVILSDAGNVYDALFMASRAALWDTKVPRTRALQYRVKVPAHPATAIGMDVDQEPDAEDGSGFDTRIMKKTATDFELPNYWDEGEVLGGRDKWPVCITMNILQNAHFLDATLPEEAAVPLRLLLMFSFPSADPPGLQAMRLVGSGELELSHLKELISKGEKYAKDMFTALESKLRDEDFRRNVKARDKFAIR